MMMARPASAYFVLQIKGLRFGVSASDGGAGAPGNCSIPVAKPGAPGAVASGVQGLRSARQRLAWQRQARQAPVAILRRADLARRLVPDLVLSDSDLVELVCIWGAA
jgi:hypothetical protein